MPSLRVNGVKLNYIEAGSGPETLVLAHGLLMSTDSYREQLRVLSARYRVVAYDHRGHGRSSSPASGYDMDTIAEDAAQLIEHLGAPVHFGGLSMGGFVGLRLAARRPHLLRSLILMATSADASDGQTVALRGLATGAVRRFGFAPIAKRAVRQMFGATYLADERNCEAALRYVKKLPKSLWRPLAAVIDRPSVAAELARIALPTLVMVGESDTLLPPAHSRRLAAAIPGAKLITVRDTGHLLSDETPAAVNAAIASFLAGVPAQQHREFARAIGA